MKKFYLPCLLLLLSLSLAFTATKPAAQNQKLPNHLQQAINACKKLSLFKNGQLDATSLKLIRQVSKNKDSLNGYPILFLAKLKKDHPPRGWGAAGTYRNIDLTIIYVFRGDALPGKTIQMSRPNPDHLKRTKTVLTPNTYFLVQADSLKNTSRFVKAKVQTLIPATVKNIQAAMVHSLLPIGWTLNNGQLTSPWTRGSTRPLFSPWTCSITGFKPLLAGKAIKVSIQPVAPKKKLKYGNPDGDGLYQVTITNTSNKKQTVKALRLNPKGRIDWHHSLLAACQGKVQPFSTIRGITNKTYPTPYVILKPGQSVKCQAQILDLKSIKWPRGGYRIQIKFCLGQQAANASFYYLSKHHDPIRKAITKNKNHR